MEQTNNYLKFLINEDIYVLPDQKPATKQAPAAPRPVVKEPEVTIGKSESVEQPTKKLLVIYNYEEAVKLPAELKTLMLKIIEAVKIDIYDAQYVNVAHQEQSEPLTKYEYVLVFSDNAVLNDNRFDEQNHFEVQNTEQTQLLAAPSLTKINDSRALKLSLWKQLKQMFA